MSPRGNLWEKPLVMTNIAMVKSLINGGLKPGKSCIFLWAMASMANCDK